MGRQSFAPDTCNGHIVLEKSAQCKNWKKHNLTRITNAPADFFIQL